MDKYITNIINFIKVKKDKQHDEVWLRAQIGHQLDLYKQEIEGQRFLEEIAQRHNKDYPKEYWDKGGVNPECVHQCKNCHYFLGKGKLFSKQELLDLLPKEKPTKFIVLELWESWKRRGWNAYRQAVIKEIEDYS